MGVSQAAHNCTTFDDVNHGFGCELRNLTPEDEVDEIDLMSKTAMNTTDSDVIWVQIRESEVKNLPKRVFERFENLEKIFIYNTTGFKDLDTSFFDKRIWFVLFKYTDLEVVDEGAFTELSNITLLALTFNKINKIHENAFKDLVKLERIELNNNEIKSLPDDVFAYNSNLKTLMLSNNKITTINAQLLSRNLKLESLIIANNLITFIEKDFNRNLSNLIKADFSLNTCVSEKVILKYISQWTLVQDKFKECYKNFQLIKGSLDAIKSIEKDISSLRAEVKSHSELVQNDMKILEGKMNNSSDMEEIRSDLLSFFEKDKKNIQDDFERNLKNVSSQIQLDMVEKVKKEVEEVLTKNPQPEQLTDHDSEIRKEFSGKFIFIYSMLFATVCFVIVAGIFVVRKNNLFSTIRFRYRSENSQLLSSEIL